MAIGADPPIVGPRRSLGVFDRDCEARGDPVEEPKQSATIASGGFFSIVTILRSRNRFANTATIRTTMLRS
ncbi:hypothetical protein [Rhodoplanes roseus]|uniref:Uncharacterized protein n=1 Tax=Rhodoplanes roseus TaxID=29409 RepID=A0A327KCM5_9BRAD|nr:hypothetical protein [Rhodoplanes roseus]RAI36539.1 hypothetical protein CH341_30290 [Rhodoplanes roseus]